jgi:hypothetical protein
MFFDRVFSTERSVVEGPAAFLSPVLTQASPGWSDEINRKISILLDNPFFRALK